MAQSQALTDLIGQLKNQTYKPKTDEEIKAQAQGEYQSYYDQLRLAAQQQQQQQDLALEQQRGALATTYSKQKEQSAKAYAQNYSQADRQALSRGMQRSSYNNQTLANINTQSAEAQQAIQDQQAAAEGNIDQQRTQLAQQLAQQISQYSASQAADVLNRMQELEDKEHDRATDANQYNNSLSQQIYQMIYQEQRDNTADDQWKTEFEENIRQYNETHGGGSGGGGGGGGASSALTTNSSTNAQASGSLWDTLLGGTQQSATSPSASGNSFIFNQKSPSTTSSGVKINNPLATTKKPYITYTAMK